MAHPCLGGGSVVAPAREGDAALGQGIRSGWAVVRCLGACPMTPPRHWSLWLWLILGTAVWVLCFIGLAYLIAEVF